MEFVVISVVVFAVFLVVRYGFYLVRSSVRKELVSMALWELRSIQVEDGTLPLLLLHINAVIYRKQLYD